MEKKKKYTILIDLDRLKDPYNGLGQVALNLAEELSRMDLPDMEFCFLVPATFDRRFGDKVQYEVITSRRRHFPFLCPAYDLWFTIHQDSGYFPSSWKTPYILTINDLNFLGEKKGIHLRYRIRRLQRKVNRASLIVSISKFTESVIRANLIVGNTPIRVNYCGVKVNEFPEARRPAFVPEGEILFTVGVVQPKKNFAVLIDFINELPEKYVLVIAGNKDGEYAAAMEQRVHELGLEKRIVLPGKISDEDKYWLYRNCKAVVFPSKLEGMGFPPVEAMRCGKPVFASTYSSIPEVSEDKAYYWDNLEPKPMADLFLEKIREFGQDASLPEVLRQHSLKYTWENSARELVKLFREQLGVKR